MSFSATRLTCYALLSAMEQDMRDMIAEVVDGTGFPVELPDEKRNKAQERRKRDGQGTAVTLPGILPYLDFAEAFELIGTLKSKFSVDQLETFQALNTRIERVVAIRNRVAHTRPMEIDDSASLIDTAALLVNKAVGWSATADTMARLEANPSYVLGLTVRLPKDIDRGPQHNLPVPDFDETGFFGRQEQLRQIKKAIKGPYPVISILGDGGIGKTSIALKAAYDLLDDPQVAFDAVVWVTAKSTILSTHEIQRIQGAIEDSLGLFDQAASYLAGQAASDPEAEILSYLENFKVLLVLDNLETVLDDRLRRFLLELPIGSKVMITSRIGVGSTEYPVNLAPLGTDDAARLLRALARIRGIQQLKELPQKTVESWVTAMSGHPAYIRWFVSGVQTGRRPEDLLTNNALLLEFCMSNVYEYLGESARAVVRSMQVLLGPRNQAELAYLNDYSADAIQSALLELLTTNFVSMSNLNTSQTVDTVYQLTDFGKQYLDKHHPVDSGEREWLLDRKDGLSQMGTGLVAQSRATPYDSATVSVRGPGDFHVARLLREALSISDEHERALELCFEAQKLSPTYSEAWRIEGYIRALDRNDHAAQAAYERAIELAPESGSARFHYGTFLLTVAGDAQAGLRALQAAAKLDSGSLEVLSGIAWAHFANANFGEAAEAAGHIFRDKQCPKHDRVSALIMLIRARNSSAQHHAEIDDVDGAVEAIELAVEFLQEVSDGDLIASAIDSILFLMETVKGIEKNSEGYAKSKCAQFFEVLEGLCKHMPGSSSRVIGRVQSIKAEKGYLFLRAESGDYFCHVRDCPRVDDWSKMRLGAVCGFTAVVHPTKGLRATSVALLEY